MCMQSWYRTNDSSMCMACLPFNPTIIKKLKNINMKQGYFFKSCQTLHGVKLTPNISYF